MIGDFAFGNSPSTTCKSVRQTPQASTFTLISPGPGCGSASSVHSRGVRGLLSTIAFIRLPHDQNKCPPTGFVGWREPGSVQLTVRSFWTEVVPGAAQAVWLASSRSYQESTVPVSVTLPPCAVTLIVAGSNHDLSNATMILSRMFNAFGLGVMAISFETPIRPKVREHHSRPRPAGSATRLGRSA